MYVTEKVTKSFKGRAKLQSHSPKEITAFDCFLSATVKIQRGNFKSF
jgi:hypothetical protein